MKTGTIMKCEKIYQRISEYIDNEIDEELRDIMEQHLLVCHRCKTLLNTIEETIRCSRQLYKGKKVPIKAINKVYYEIHIRYEKKKKNETY
mgnify:CR=1 FL=1